MLAFQASYVGSIPIARSKFRYSLTQAKFDPEEVAVRRYTDEGLPIKGLSLTQAKFDPEEEVVKLRSDEGPISVHYFVLKIE